ncbi:MAG: GlcNAc-transferase family protein [Pseudomonadota bacterium]
MMRDSRPTEAEIETARIFVQIPSYRDRECQHTIRDLFDKARFPDRVFVGVCWQFDAEHDQDCFDVDPGHENLRRIDFDYREAQGLGWARAQAQSLWQGEEYTLQIDSHMRFVPDWDVQMLHELADCPSRWPVLTIYPAGYLPPDQLLDTEGQQVPVQTVKGVHAHGIAQFTVDYVPSEVTLDAPSPTASLAGGFVFGSSRMIEDVPSDPAIYFLGEEPNLAVRLYTHGFDLFSPRKTLIYHYYQRVESRRPWDDASPARPTERTILRMAQLMQPRPGDAEALGMYGLGTERSLYDYQAFAGVDIAARSVASFTRFFPFVYTEEVCRTLLENSDIAPADDAELVVLDDCGVLFCGRFRRFYRLNAMATAIWCALCDEPDLDEIIAQVAAFAPDLEQAALHRAVYVQLCHWQTWGVLQSFIETPNPSDVEARAAITAVRPKLTPVLDPEVLRARHTYALTAGNVVVEYYDQDAFHAVHPAFSAYAIEPDGSGQARCIRLLVIGGFRYAVVDDCFPPIRIATAQHSLAAVITALAEIEDDDLASLLHIDGGICGIAEGRPALVLGGGAAEVAAKVVARTDGAGLPPVFDERTIALLTAFRSALGFRIGKDGGAIRLIRRPQLFFTELEAELEALVTDLADAPLHHGFGERLVRTAPFATGPDDPFDVLDLILLDLDASHQGEASIHPVTPAEVLFEVLNTSRRLPKPRSVDDALTLVEWAESREAYRVTAPSADAAVEAIERTRCR